MRGSSIFDLQVQAMSPDELPRPEKPSYCPECHFPNPTHYPNCQNDEQEPNQDQMSKLFKITIEAFKQFYVEAETQEDAFNHIAVEDEKNTRFSGDFDWEHDGTDAEEVPEEQAKWIRANRQKEIAQ